MRPFTLTVAVIVGFQPIRCSTLRATHTTAGCPAAGRLPMRILNAAQMREADGFVVARTLLQRGIDAAVFVVGALADVRGDAKTNLEILGRLGVTVVEIGDEQTWELHFSEISQCTLIVDAIFGTGLTAP